MNTDDLNTFQDTLGLINTKTKRSSLVRHRDHMSINCDCYWITVNKKPKYNILLFIHAFSDLAHSQQSFLKLTFSGGFATFACAFPHFRVDDRKHFVAAVL